MRKQTNNLLLFFIIIFFAGFTFLIYEVSWFRMLSLVIGATVSASTIVLVAFMLGIGIGAYYWGKKVSKNNSPEKILYYLFVAIGAIGFINYFLIKYFLPSLYPSFHHIGISASFTELFVLIIVIILLFIPTFFMGGILPSISKIIISSNKGIASNMGKIYAYETIGSTLGGLMTGFILIGNLGQKNTVFLAVVINLLIAAIVLFTKKYYFQAISENIVATIENKNTSKPKKTTENASHFLINKKIALIATFICGFVVVGMQVVWFRIFRIYMTNTSYTFSLIASMVILGLFAGSWFYMKRGENIKQQSYTILKVILLIGFLMLIGLFILLKLPSLILFPLGSFQEVHIIRILIIPLISSLFVIIPITFLSGYAFPLACTMYTKDYKDISQSIGHILLSNTAGSILGPLLAAYIFIPLMGAGLSIIVFVFILLIIAFIIANKMAEVKNINRLKGGIVVFGIIILIILIIHPKMYILPPSFSKYQKQILAYKETTEGTYVVGKEVSDENIVLSTYVNNSSVIGSSYDAIKAVKMVGHIPFFAGLQCKDALVVGFGIGVTASAIASHPEVKSIDCVELVAGLKNAAHFYSDLNNNIERDIRLKIYSGDGRHFLQSSTKMYDLISSDPTHPILGSGNIYTQEYFKLCKAHLNKGGMISQYLPLHKLLLKDFLGIIKTFHSVFPDATVWIGHYHAILIGSNGSMKIDFAKWADNISKSVKDIYFYTNAYHVAACLVMDSTKIVNFPKDIRIITDDYSDVEFFSFSSFNGDNLTKNLLYLNQNRCQLAHVFFNIPDKSKMDKFIKGNILLTDGLYYFLQGNSQEFHNKLEFACKVNPEDEEFPFLIKFYFK